MHTAAEPARAGAGLHILLIDAGFHDARAPGPTRGFDFAVRAIGAGHRVTVIAADTIAAAAATTALQVRARTPARREGWDLPVVERARFARWAAREMWRVKEVDAAIVVADPSWVLVPSAIYAFTRAIPLIADVRAVPPPAPAAGAPFTTKLRAFLRRIGRKIALRLAHRCLVASPAVMTAVTDLGVTEARRLQLPMGCDAALLTLAAGADNAVLREMPELAGHPLVVWAGAFTADRPIARLLDLAQALLSAAPTTTLVLCGDGPTRPDVIRQIHERGFPESAITVLNPLPRKQMADLLSLAAVVLALPSANDTASDFFDGLAAGKPVVTFAESWQRTLLESRSAGFGVALDDPAAAAREIADVLRDPDGLRRTGQQAAALAAGRYDLDRLVAEVRVALETLVATAPRADILRRRTLFWKRTFDIVVAALGLIVLAPVALVLAILIGLKLGWPVVVVHDRAGLKGRPFRLFKFRTLTDAEGPTGTLLPETQRQTPLGRFLRATALDEWPTLANVLIGDLSLVGPRPLPVAYTTHYTPAQRRRLDLRPGLTGQAQVERSAASWDEVFARDVAYVDGVSLGLDAKIMLKTLALLLTGAKRERAGAPARFDEMMAHQEGAEDV